MPTFFQINASRGGPLGVLSLTWTETKQQVR